MNIEIGVGIGNGGLSQVQTDRLLAYAWASAGSPSVSASSDLKVNGVLANSNISAIPPSLSKSDNISVLAVLANVNGGALNPTISAIRNNAIYAGVANSNANTIPPNLSNNLNASVLAVVTSGNASILIPVVSTVRNASVAAVVTSGVASAGVPTVSVGSASTIIVSDSFNRSNSTTGLGDAETGQSWIQSGTIIGINSNTAYTIASGDGYATIDSGISDGYVQYKNATYHAWNKLIYRFVDLNNYYRVEAGGVYKKTGGAQSSLASFTAPASGDIVSVKIEGNVHTIYKNGVQVATFTDSFNQTVTTHGFSISTTTARIDDFKVETL